MYCISMWMEFIRKKRMEKGEGKENEKKKNHCKEKESECILKKGITSLNRNLSSLCRL